MYIYKQYFIYRKYPIIGLVNLIIFVTLAIAGYIYMFAFVGLDNKKPYFAIRGSV
jgi:hypothetical protein